MKRSPTPLEGHGKSCLVIHPPQTGQYKIITQVRVNFIKLPPAVSLDTDLEVDARYTIYECKNKSGEQLSE